MLSIDNTSELAAAIRGKVLEKRAFRMPVRAQTGDDGKIKWDSIPQDKIIDTKVEPSALDKILPDNPEKIDTYVPHIMGIGGGILTNAIINALTSDKSDEDKRKKTIWDKVLSTLGIGARLGASGAAGYGMYLLGKKLMEKKSAWGYPYTYKGQNHFIPMWSNIGSLEGKAQELYGDDWRSHVFSEDVAKAVDEDRRNLANSEMAWGLGLGAGGYAADRIAGPYADASAAAAAEAAGNTAARSAQEAAARSTIDASKRQMRGILGPNWRSAERGLSRSRGVAAEQATNMGLGPGARAAASDVVRSTEGVAREVRGIRNAMSEAGATLDSLKAVPASEPGWLPRLSRFVRGAGRVAAGVGAAVGAKGVYDAFGPGANVGTKAREAVENGNYVVPDDQQQQQPATRANQ